LIDFLDVLKTFWTISPCKKQVLVLSFIVQLAEQGSSVLGFESNWRWHQVKMTKKASVLDWLSAWPFGSGVAVVCFSIISK
jgi:hypothetical protein